MASFLIAALTSSSPGGLLTRQDALPEQEIPQRPGAVHQISGSSPLLDCVHTQTREVF